MTILVLSDTHISDTFERLPEDVQRQCEHVDGIIHAGDFTSLELLKSLEEKAPVTAVCGNSDRFDVISILPSVRTIELDGLQIGITHGLGTPNEVPYRVRNSFTKPDVIIFGHSHVPYNKKLDGVLMFNPGSPTDRRTARFCSFGILEINNGSFKTRIVPINE